MRERFPPGQRPRAVNVALPGTLLGLRRPLRRLLYIARGKEARQEGRCAQETTSGDPRTSAAFTDGRSAFASSSTPSPTTRSTCSIPRAMWRAGTPAPSASRATPPRKSSAGISRCFYTEEDRRRGLPATALADIGEHGQVRGRGLARAQGRHPLLGACRDRSDPRRVGRR